MSRNRGFGVIGGGGGGGGGATRNGLDFVFRPGGTTGGNVYADQASLAAAVAAARGSRRIFIDTTLGAAVWDTTMDFGSEQGPVEVLGTSSVVATTALTIATGANIRGVSRWTDLAIDVTSAAAVCDGPIAGNLEVEFCGRTSVQCSAAALIAPTRIAPAALVRLILRGEAAFFDNGYPVAEMPNLLSIVCDLHDRANVEGNTLKGSNRVNSVNQFGSYASGTATQLLSGVGSWTLYDFTALRTSYDPTLIAEGISATSVQGAVDFLKQQVWRASDYVNTDPGQALGGAARTCGARVRLNRPREAIGIRFAWHCAVLTTVTARLRVVGTGTVLASAAVDVDAAGVYYAEFGAAVDLTAYQGVELSVDVYDGADYWYAPDTGSPARPMPLDACVTLLGYYHFAGNGNPNTAGGTNVYGVDLVTRGAS